MTKTELFEAIVNDTVGWKASLNEMWSCLNQDDKARATALATGSDPFSDSAPVNCDECTWEFISGGSLALSGTYQAITPPVGAEAAKIQFVSTDTDVAQFNVEASLSPTAPFIVSQGGIITLYNPAEIAAFRMKSTSGAGDAYIQFYSIP